MKDLSATATYAVYIIDRATQKKKRMVGTYPCRCVAEDVINKINFMYEDTYAYIQKNIDIEEGSEII
jgi:hypothetical protein